MQPCKFIIEEAPSDWQQDVLKMMDWYGVAHQKVTLDSLGIDRAIYILNTQIHGGYWGEGNLPFDFFRFLSPPLQEAVRINQVVLCLDASNQPFDSLHWLSKSAEFEAHYRTNGGELQQIAILTCDMAETQHHYKKLYPQGKATFFPYSVSADYVLPRCESATDRYYATSELRPHKYLCLMNFPRDHRVLLMLHLLEERLDQHGIIGFINGPLPRPTHDNVAELLQRHGLGRSLMKHVDTMLNHSWAPDDYGPHDGNDCWISPQHYNDSYFNVTVESYWDQASPYYTEKISKPILLRQPFLLLGPVQTLAAVHRRGFASFSPYIDESYDAEPDPMRRFFLVLEQIKKLCDMSQIELHQWYHGPIKEIVNHNYRVYRDKTTCPLHDIVEQLRVMTNASIC